MLVVHAGTVRSTRNILNDTASQEKVLKHREGWIGKKCNGGQSSSFFFSCENSSIPRFVTHSLTDSHTGTDQDRAGQLAITHSIFKLEALDFAWQFLWTPRKNKQFFSKGVWHLGWRGTSEYTLKWTQLSHFSSQDLQILHGSSH